VTAGGSPTRPARATWDGGLHRTTSSSAEAAAAQLQQQLRGASYTVGDRVTRGPDGRQGGVTSAGDAYIDAKTYRQLVWADMADEAAEGIRIVEAERLREAAAAAAAAAGGGDGELSVLGCCCCCCCAGLGAVDRGLVEMRGLESIFQLSMTALDTPT